MKQRYVHFDVLKGIAILLVIFGHIYLLCGGDYGESVILNILISVHMPIFFLVSGYFSARDLDLSGKGIIKYWQNKAIRLLLPLLCLPFLMNCIKNGFSLSLPLEQIVPNRGVGSQIGYYWFTYVMFTTYIVFYAFKSIFTILEHKLKFITGGGLSELVYFLGSIVVTAICIRFIAIYAKDIYYILLLAKVAWLYKFLVMGYLMARYRKFEGFVRQPLVSAVAFFAFIGLIYAEYVFNFNPLNGLVATLFGLLFFYYLAYQMGEKKSYITNFFSFIGKEAFPIYLTHYFFLPNLPWLHRLLSEEITNRSQVIVWEFWIGILAIAMVLVPTLIVIRIVKTNPYLAFLLYGEKIPYKR